MRTTGKATRCISVFVTSVLAALVLAARGAAQGAPLVDLARELVAALAPARDDPDAEFATLLAAAKNSAASPASELAIDAAQERLATLQRPAVALDAVESFLASDPHGLAARAARAMRAELQLRLRRLDALRARPAYADQASLVLAIGPFGDAGDHYNGVVFSPELAFPDAGQQLPGRYGPVAVRVVHRPAWQRTLELAADGASHPGCFYGLHQVRCQGELACWVEVLCRGSFELFVNGERRASVDRNAVRTKDESYVPVRLADGVNHVLVKTTSLRSNDVALRYVDGAGRSIEAVTELRDSTVLQHAPPAKTAHGAPLFDDITVLARAAERSTGEDAALLRLAAAWGALRGHDFDRALPVLDALDSTPPSDPASQLALAQLWLDSAPLPEDVRRDRARAMIEAAAPQLPTHQTALLLQAQLMQDQDRGEEAARLLQSSVASGRAGPRTFARLWQLFDHLGFDAQARQTRTSWRAAWPADVQPLLDEVSERARDGDARGALALALTALPQLPQDQLRRQALQLAVAAGDAAHALELVAALHELDPDALEASIDKALALHALARGDDAAAIDARIADDARASAREVRAAGERLLASSRNQEALRALTHALELAPDQHDLRRLLHRLLGEPDFPEFEAFRRDGDAAIAAFQPGDREHGASSTLVLDQMLVRVYEDGSWASEVHQVRRINDLQGVEQFQQADRAAHAAEVVLVRTVGNDGASYLPHRVDNSFAMPRLAPGAFVEEIYRDYARSPQPGPWRAPSFYFQGADEPYLLTEYVIALPEGARGRFRSRGAAPKEQTQDLTGGLVTHTFRLTDVPRLPSEQHAPPIEDLVPVLAFGEDGDYSARARDRRARAQRLAQSSPAVAKKAVEVCAKQVGQMAKARAIHEFTQSAITDGAGAADPTSVLLTGRGPRLFLEVALLRAAGIAVRDAVCDEVQTALTGLPMPLFQGDDVPDLPAALVACDDGPPVWLFADLPRHTPLGFVPAQRQGAEALLLEPSGFEPSHLPGGDGTAGVGIALQGTLDLGDHGEATFTGEVAVRGIAGYIAAEQLRNVEDSVRDVVARQLATRLFPGWRPVTLALDGLDPPGQPLRLRGALRRSGVVAPVGDHSLLTLSLVESRFLSAMGDRGDRHLPLRLTDLDSAQMDVVIDAGKSYRFAAVPADTHFHHPLLDFDQTFTLADGKIAMRRVVAQRPGEVSVSQFSDWVDQLRALDQAEAVSLELAER